MDQFSDPKMKMTFYSIFNAPFGKLLLVANATHLIGIYFDDCDHVPSARNGWSLNPQHSILRDASLQLQEYFDRERTTFSIPVHFAGTDFQNRVWKEIALIPYGKTITYSELAQKAGAPNAIRAAGSSTGRNALSIVIPCHRVVGKNGGFGGYAGGLKRKRYLLDLEETSRPGLDSTSKPHSYFAKAGCFGSPPD
jgi:methylated-DNA-[protein]-cysteine S-methyltransferase